MSIGYYVRDVARYNDYKKLSDYWDSSFKDDVCKLMTDYCSDNKIDEACCEEVFEEIEKVENDILRTIIEILDSNN